MQTYPYPKLNGYGDTTVKIMWSLSNFMCCTC